MNPKKFNMVINIVIAIGLVYLLIMPIYYDVHYIKLYYTTIIFFGIPLLIYQCNL